MKPSFVGIGAQKCASTWLYDILADHPSVALGDDKELDFFSNYFDRGYQWYEERLADDATKLTGEVSPSYFHGVDVPARIFDYDPTMRLILFLRDPIERAMSNHKHEIRIGHLAGDDLSFERGLENNPSYIEQGLYGSHLARWLEFFPRQQIHIVSFDSVITDGAKVAKGIYEFLEIETGHVSVALEKKSY